MTKYTFFIAKGGETRAIYSPETKRIAEKLGEPEVRRASHVESGHDLSSDAVDWLNTNGIIKIIATEDKYDLLVAKVPVGLAFLIRETEEPMQRKFWADLLPVGGPVLGPFDERPEALAAESAWLIENHIPVPSS